MFKSLFTSAASKRSSSAALIDQEREVAELRANYAAMDRVQAIIEFNLDGTIIRANENFLNVMGYTLDEVRAKHHSIFVEPGYAQDPEYAKFWKDLNAGEFVTGQFKRIGKSGRVVWIQASYNPVLDSAGNPYKVVKFATDITKQMTLNSDYRGQIAAINKSQAVIEFEMDGSVITANDNFLGVMGYSLAELQGKHHSIFVQKEYANSAEYRDFWEQLRRGEYVVSEFLRLGKGGKEVWIHASYNPISGPDGKLFKVVKYATDITAQKLNAVVTENIVRDLSRLLSSMAKGDLREHIDGDYEGAFGALKDDANTSLDKLTEIVSQINVSADSVNSAASEISSGIVNLSQRTEEQASSLEETSSSMEEMTSTVKQNAENAQQANQLAMSAREQAENGGEVVGSAVRAMGEINSSSRKIADIISVIDEIAFQTNLLALNASVEAARAGEQGRGFAVVASEVRNLAGRSATAAKEIKELIQDSVAKVEDGSRLVNQSGETLEQIVSSVKKVTDIVAEISAASREQASGIEQVNKVIMQMDDTTQQNAALVEEASAASDSMRDQAQQLARLVRFFEIRTQAGGLGRERKASGPGQIERRSADRPWSEQTAKAPAARDAAPQPTRHAVAGGDGADDSWEEF